MNVRNVIDNLGMVLPAAGVDSTPASSPLTLGQTGTHAEGHTAAQLAQDQAHLSLAAGQIAESAIGPDVRMDKVADIQKVLTVGTYNVSAQALAKKLISSMLAQG